MSWSGGGQEDRIATIVQQVTLSGLGRSAWLPSQARDCGGTSPYKVIALCWILHRTQGTQRLTQHILSIVQKTRTRVIMWTNKLLAKNMPSTPSDQGVIFEISDNLL